MPVVLVIDDDAMACQLACVVLRHAGHDVHEARSGGEGLCLAQQHVPDVILLDMHMPAMDGFQVVKQIRLSERCAGVRVLALTGMAMVGDEAAIRQAGCDDYMTKPYAYRDLLDAVARLAATPRPSAESMDHA